jgi:uncharacterized protein YqgC (DUF456 family)
MESSLSSDSVRTFSPAEPSRKIIDWLFALTIASFFSGLNQRLGPAKVQLSDILCIVTIAVVMLRGFVSPRVSAPVMLSLLAYLTWYAVSALSLDLRLGVKEIVQTSLLFAFSFVAFGYYQNRSTGSLLAFTSALTLCVLGYNIAWHVSHGYYVSWKQLNEPKTIFIVLPLLIVLASDRLRSRRRLALSVAAAIAGVIILLSGERKAYLFALVAVAIWTAPLNWRHLLGAMMVIPFLWIGLTSDHTGYLDRQLSSLSGRLSSDSVATASLASLIADERPGTLSDVQREFTLRMARQMWSEHPLLGIGTNAFKERIETYETVPSSFRVGIHGEFYRALYENGVVGLALYSAIWLCALVSILRSWNGIRRSGDPTLNRIRLICFVMLITYCSAEAAKGLTQVSICLLPFLCGISVRRDRHSSAAGVIREYPSVY